MQINDKFKNIVIETIKLYTCILKVKLQIKFRNVLNNLLYIHKRNLKFL